MEENKNLKRTPHPLSHKHSLYLLKKLTGDGSQRTVCEPCTNYTNNVFVNQFLNKIFVSVYAAVDSFIENFTSTIFLLRYFLHRMSCFWEKWEKLVKTVPHNNNPPPFLKNGGSILSWCGGFCVHVKDAVLNIFQQSNLWCEFGHFQSSNSTGL